MFYELSNITRIIFERFEFSGTSMYGMFLGCNNLISLNLSHFDTSSVTDMEAMLWGCSNLISLNLSHFNTSSVTSMNMNKMFNNCNNNLVYYINNNNTILNHITSS